MRYYEVFVADARYRSNSPLTYSSQQPLDIMNVVTVPLRARMVTGFVTQEVNKPQFNTKPIRTLLSKKPLPTHSIELAQWTAEYYACTLGEVLRQFAPSRPSVQRRAYSVQEITSEPSQLELESPLTKEQAQAIDSIIKNPSRTVLLHGYTGTGKTRVYLELAQKTLAEEKSVLLLTPEIALTPQLTNAAKKSLGNRVVVLHSQLTQAKRKEIWLSILEAEKPLVIVGPRSALFSPVHNLGLVVLDESHEPAYKQDQSPRYHAARIASQIGVLTEAKVVLGSATPSLTDYYLATKHAAVVKMKERAISGSDEIKTQIIDLKDRSNFSASRYFSSQLIDAIKQTLKAKKQVLIYLNRRGSARLILCNKCGWQLLCPNCDVPLVYHGDDHSVRCHICGFLDTPPGICPTCQNPDIIYKSIGTKALIDEVIRLFPDRTIQRFDSDNLAGEHVHELYDKLHKGEIDILVGTQLLAKGLDLPRLGLVGIISAETSLSLPDYSSEERAFQLLYQVIGRVGRGHNKGEVILQSYEPNSVIVQAAIERDYGKFYDYSIKERQQFRFPPFSYLMQLTCRRATLKGAEQAAKNLKEQLVQQRLAVEIIGPAPSFYSKKGKYYYWQIVIKSKERSRLLELAKTIPQDWIVDIDPVNLL
jgi:primosomal protein N' (replication factor Y)